MNLRLPSTLAVCALALSSYADQTMRGEATRLWVAGYWYSPPVWGGLPVSEIDFSALTHVMHFSVVPVSNGTLSPTSVKQVTEYAAPLVRSAHDNQVRVLLSVADSMPEADFRSATSDLTRGALVSQLMKLVRTYGYDGIDIDWEKNIDPLQFAGFVKELRRELNTLRPPGQLTGAFFEPGMYLAPVAAAFDQINVMAYDLGSPQDGFSWHNAALYDAGDARRRSVDWRVRQFFPISKRSQLGLGIPFYGYVWSAPDKASLPEVTAPAQTWKRPPRFRFLSYRDIAGDAALWRGVHRRDLPAGKVPYLSLVQGGPDGAGLVTYEDEISITEKIAYAKKQGLGGVMIWELSADYLPHQNPRHPLLRAVRKAVAGN
jgi:chitinase